MTQLAVEYEKYVFFWERKFVHRKLWGYTNLNVSFLKSENFLISGIAKCTNFLLYSNSTVYLNQFFLLWFLFFNTSNKYIFRKCQVLSNILFVIFYIKCLIDLWTHSVIFLTSNITWEGTVINEVQINYLQSSNIIYTYGESWSIVQTWT